MVLSLDTVRDADRRIRPAVVATPAVPAPRLSAVTGAEIRLKLENLQETGSFKVRGALNKLLSLDADACRHGVIAMSAGNHAQGVAFHARRLGIPATIVMPLTTPFTKVERTKALGAEILLKGETLSEAAAAARTIAERERLTFVHPYDDELVIAGQGTVTLEFLRDVPDLDALVVPVGGGGLIAGAAIVARALYPSLRLYGVQAALYPAMADRLHGRAGDGGSGSTLAEGIAVKQPGEITGRIIAEAVSEMLLVSEAALERAVNLLMVQSRVIAEGAGAAALAAVLAHPDLFRGRRTGLIVSGGNIDARILASILMRGLSREGRIARLRVEITDAPGMLAKVAGAIAGAGGNIVEIYHQRLFQDVPVTRTDLDIVVETRGPDHLDEIVGRLAAEGLGVRHLPDTGAEWP